MCRVTGLGKIANLVAALKGFEIYLFTSRINWFLESIVPCLLRAVPCSAGTFASVELALRLMG